MDILKPSELVKWIVRFRSEILLMNKKRGGDALVAIQFTSITIKCYAGS